jgi:hypothetical protein
VTVNAPALAKNTIAVGNTLNANEYTPFSASAVPIHTVKFMVQAGNATSSMQVRVAQAAFSGAWKAWPNSAPVVLADPFEVRLTRSACPSLMRAPHLALLLPQA